MSEYLPPEQRRVRLFLLCRCSRHLVIATTAGEVADRANGSGWKLAVIAGSEYDVCPECQSEERAA
jgi:hypothetical protein